MTTATVSTKYQISIPVKIRKTMGIKAGMKFEFIPYNGRIELIMLQPLSEMQGYLKGMDTTNIREKKDRIL